jgi:hypothetical protein
MQKRKLKPARWTTANERIEVYETDQGCLVREREFVSPNGVRHLEVILGRTPQLALVDERDAGRNWP